MIYDDIGLLKSGFGRSEFSAERDLKAFDHLLSLAEDLHSKREMLRKQFLVGSGAATTAILVSVAAFASYPFNISFNKPELLSTPIAMVLASVAVFAYLLIAFLTAYYIKTRRRQTRAIEEVMSIIHEVLQSAEVEMSPLEVAQIRIRLSMMDN